MSKPQTTFECPYLSEEQRLMDCRLGLLINFGENLLKDGFKRVVNGFDEDS